MKLAFLKMPCAVVVASLLLAACGGADRSGGLMPQTPAQAHMRATGSQSHGRPNSCSAATLGTQYAVLSTTAKNANVHFQSSVSVQGDLGVNATMGQLQLDPGAVVHGVAHVQHGLKVQNHGTISGGVLVDPTGLATAVSNAQDVSCYDASLPNTIGSPSTINLKPNQSLTINGANVPGTVNVLSFTQVQMGPNSTLTFNAPAGSSFVLNVAGEAHPAPGAKVLVTGGISAGDVVFNFIGMKGNVQIEQNDTFSASILAFQRTVTIEQSAVVGGVIVADGGNLQLQNKVSVLDSAPSVAPYFLFGDATLVQPGYDSPNAVSATSTGPNAYGGVDVAFPAGLTVAGLTNYSTEYMFTLGSCGLGSPRLVATVTNGTNTGNINFYVGPYPNYTGCPPNVWGNTGNLAAPTNYVDDSQLGGSFYDLYSNTQAMFGSYTVIDMFAVVDGPGQTTEFDDIAINGNTLKF